MVLASGRPARHAPFGHLYLSTIMMVFALVFATSFDILLFSLSPHVSASAPPHSQQRAWEQTPPPHIWLTPTPTLTRTVAIAPPRGRFTTCAQHRFRCHRTSRSSFRSSPCSSSPTHCPPPTVAAESRPTLVHMGTGRVGLAPGLSPCMLLRRTRWHLPCLGYLSDEESRYEILDNQGL
jgi:hypothetical protein